MIHGGRVPLNGYLRHIPLPEDSRLGFIRTSEETGRDSQRRGLPSGCAAGQFEYIRALAPKTQQRRRQRGIDGHFNRGKRLDPLQCQQRSLQLPLNMKTPCCLSIPRVFRHELNVSFANEAFTKQEPATDPPELIADLSCNQSVCILRFEAADVCCQLPGVLRMNRQPIIR
ncbi:hypothetical protein D3C75_644560 [compost metagenome]